MNQHHRRRRLRIRRAIRRSHGRVPSGRTVWEALPIEAAASTWGDEIYFSIPVTADAEPGACADVAVGDLAYRPPGHARVPPEGRADLFFGRTPASTGDSPRAASPVRVIGRVAGDATVFRRIRSGFPIRLARV